MANQRIIVLSRVLERAGFSKLEESKVTSPAGEDRPTIFTLVLWNRDQTGNLSLVKEAEYIIATSPEELEMHKALLSTLLTVGDDFSIRAIWGDDCVYQATRVGDRSRSVAYKSASYDPMRTVVNDLVLDVLNTWREDVDSMKRAIEAIGKKLDGFISDTASNPFGFKVNPYRSNLNDGKGVPPGDVSTHGNCASPACQCGERSDSKPGSGDVPKWRRIAAFSGRHDDHIRYVYRSEGRSLYAVVYSHARSIDFLRNMSIKDVFYYVRYDAFDYHPTTDQWDRADVLLGDGLIGLIGHVPTSSADSALIHFSPKQPHWSGARWTLASE